MTAKPDFPVLGLREFLFDSESDYRLLYHTTEGKNHIDKPHKHDFFFLFLVEHGSGIHSIDFTEYPVTPSQVHILFPEQVHKWHLGEETSGFQLMISRRVFETFLTSLHFAFILYQNHSVINLAPESFALLFREFQAVQEELKRRPTDWDIVYSRAKLIVQLVGREAESRFEDLRVFRANPLLSRYHSLVDAWFKEHKSVAFYADKLHISANYLNILCKRYLHVPAMFLIQNRVSLEARRLLHASDKSIKEIAFDLGFNDLAYFSNFFKSHMGVSPRQFREQL